MVIVDKLWPGATIVCIASGPSLTAEDVDYVRGKARVIVVNTSYKLAPWADVLYAADPLWWTWHKGAPDFQGLKFSAETENWKMRWIRKCPDVQQVAITGEFGLELNPAGLRRGYNSGYQAINLAVHLGATRIVLLGYDMQIGPHGEEHWHDDHPHANRSRYDQFRRAFPTLVEPLQKLGIEIVNCTRRSALTCFPRAALRDVLVSAEVAA